MKAIQLPSRWTPVPQFPLTTAIYTHVLRGSHRRSPTRSDVVSGSLCDDILRRVSPYLRRNSPVDILDLWPGSGFWSSQVNDFLRPRRHVLIEPDIKAFRPLLQPLAASKPCYELLSKDIFSIQDWTDIMKQYFPEQGPSNRNTTGVLPKNDTLLVLANPPDTFSKKNHYTAARWWSMFMETCMKQSGLHQYGSVRIMAWLPLTEIQAVLPRSVVDRKRPAVLTESLALHTVELADHYEFERWFGWKTWDAITSSTKRAAERSAAQNIVVPEGRERPRMRMAPESPHPGGKPCPYVPRARTERHERLIREIKELDLELEHAGAGKPPKSEAAEKRRRALIAALNQENRSSYIRNLFVKNQLEIDLMSRTLSRAAADPATSPERLKSLDDQIATLQSAATEQIANTHYITASVFNLSTDDARTALLSRDSDDSVLLSEQRPFEPLRIHPEEMYPRGVPRSLIYFEADADSPAMQKLQSVPAEERADVIGLFNAFSFILGTRNVMSVAALLQSLLPGRSINDLVKAIPSLAPCATKRIKPGAGPAPLEGASDSTDPNRCFQENVDYDLSNCRLRCLPVPTLWDILLEYQKNSMDLSTVQLNRLLGGTLTNYRAGDYSGGRHQRLH